MSGAIIDDCAPVAQIKRIQSEEHSGGNLWLGHARDVHSVRRYGGLSSVWDMVARTAYPQLDYSPVLLMLTVLAMLMVYVMPPLASVFGIAGLVLADDWVLSACTVAACATAWVLMTASSVPMLRWYRVSVLRALLLSAAGVL